MTTVYELLQTQSLNDGARISAETCGLFFEKRDAIAEMNRLGGVCGNPVVQTDQNGFDYDCYSIEIRKVR